MMLEVLFARAGQGVTFLRLMCGGVLLGAAMDGCFALRRRWPRLALLWEVTAALMLAGLMLPTLLLAGEGVRAYGLLGLALGVLLYSVGVRYLIRGVLSIFRKISFRQKQEDTP